MNKRVEDYFEAVEEELKKKLCSSMNLQEIHRVVMRSWYYKQAVSNEFGFRESILADAIPHMAFKIWKEENGEE